MRKLIVLLSMVFLVCAGCNDAPTADQATQKRQEQMQAQQIAQTGLPNIVNFTEAKLVKHLYELRDSKIATYAYIRDEYDGKLFHLCDSIGYGLPYAVQFSNPEKQVESYGSGYITMPQAEPNGLFMPASAEGTWVMCANPNSKLGVDPVYVEPRVIVSPFKLKSSGEYAEQ